ncbi:holdfast anchoring protein HfaA [Brevundimonas sp.]|uniref:holdfast anchoring protein HfaA n=1 Tax=Brevundimonas sp. TaxID=1871086 RepID=UPI002898FC51|nr:holdfast anchoring protein HfaA [Brevundimonas sp.]
MRFNPRFLAALTALGLALNGACVLPVLAQSGGGSAVAPFQAGYGAARYTTARPNNGSTRDANGNRLIVNGIIQAGASSYSSGAASATAGAGARANAGQSGQGSTAIGNSLNVVVQGSRNTVVVNSNQTNTGNVSAGTVLNGTLVFP